jgi:hypothetical protein
MTERSRVQCLRSEMEVRRVHRRSKIPALRQEDLMKVHFEIDEIILCCNFG